MINHLCKNILVSRREIYISALYSVSFQNASKQTIKERKMEENQAALEMDLATRMKMGEFIKSPTMCSTFVFPTLGYYMSYRALISS